MQHLSIGAVSKLTDIPAHTLRKWESRHGIATPTRTPTGRRVYTQDQVDELRLIKALMASGHALAHLKDLRLLDLQELAGLHDNSPSRVQANSVILVGPNVARCLTSQPLVRRRFLGALGPWLESAPKITAEDAIVAEATTIPADLIPQLVELRQGVTDLLVVYNFASSRALEALTAANVRVIRGPVSDADLLLRLQFDPDAVEMERPQHRFGTEELARIAAMSPGLQCECPNHIAKILMDISAFEHYSSECVDTDPSSRALHEELGVISARARALFEDALVTVATADGIALDVQS